MSAKSAALNGSPGIYAPQGIEIPAEHLLRIQGYRDMGLVREDVRGYAASMAERAKQLIRPQAHFRREAIELCRDGSLTLAAGTRFRSEELTKVLKDCEALFVFVLTLGPELDAESERLLWDEQVVEALFLETAGWIAVEQATRDLARHLQSVDHMPEVRVIEPRRIIQCVLRREVRNALQYGLKGPGGLVGLSHMSQRRCQYGVARPLEVG